MYSTCLFCSTALGSNEELEIFPVGSRLAFDATRGRLWVVCRSCERWNLSPLEERWEAIEACEERYSRTRLRVTTDNIGLAKLKSGLELVRIGEPQRPEMAAWRYGDQFGRRRRRMMIRAGAGLGLLGAAVGGGAAAGLSVVVFTSVVSQLADRIIKGSPNAIVARVRHFGDATLEVKREDLERVRLGSSSSGALQLAIPHGNETMTLEGETARQAAGVLLPAINRYGGSKRDVQLAVSELEHHGSADAFLQAAATVPGVLDPKPILERPTRVRLALEMALHEQAERRALEGELAMLEAAWRDAENIARISDNLLLPRSVMDRIAGLKRQR